ncbi:hypothetical protein RHMOL_Rhmol11G0177500 [Rhododendron molle]|uniref:Uncharacterized protein n=1 Tax=Rhododendron molle TaxID=49168 RepID=A0ACC0LTR6_RHOML|nr:hypothetical protein RHMOL_Rhmol11G0177500 [Rhododendron molle]
MPEGVKCIILPGGCGGSRLSFVILFSFNQLFMFHGFDRGQTMAGPNANARGKPVGFHLGTYVERRERVLASKVAALC